MTYETNRLFRNAAERERFKTQLEGRSLLLFVTLASIGDAVITTDGDGDITFLNPMAQTLTGWTLEEAVGIEIERVFRVVDETTGEEIPNPIREALGKVAKVDLPADAMLVRKDGSRIPIDDSGAPILGVEDEILGAVLVFRDITERKEAENMLKYRSELDRMASRISTAFITSPVSEVNNHINKALKDIGEFFEADRAYVFLHNANESALVCTNEWCAPGVECLKGLKVPISLAPYWTHRIAERQHIRINHPRDVSTDASVETAIISQRGIKTIVAVPMLQEDKVLGLLGIESIEEDKPWRDDTVNLLYLIGNVFASAMERRDAQLKLEAARAREVQIGASIQQTLLLSTPPLESPDFQVAALTVPSRGVDGDFYDFILHPNRYLDVIFGDVMGKGLPAALLSAGAKTEFLRSLSHLLVSSPRGSIPQPQDIVNGVHGVLTPQLLNLDSFVTLSYVRLDPENMKVTIVDCGNTRLMRCADDGTVEYLSGYNLPLGFSPSEVYSDAEYNFAAEDIFVLYSDGVTEARNPDGEMFGRERLSELISVKRRLNTDLIIRAVQEAVTAFVGTKELADDFTCVVIKVRNDPVHGPLPANDELEIASSLSELGTIRNFLRSFCERRGICGLEEAEFKKLELAVNEVASNIMKHAYHGREDRSIAIRVELEADCLKVRLSHSGDPFINREQVPPPSFNGTREGGFGLFIIRQAVDKIEYGVDDIGRQFVELKKNL